MADCIDALITANIKTTLEGITVANGYSTEIGIVEEKRSEFNMSNAVNQFTILERLPPDIDEDYQHTEDATLKFIIYHFNGEDDTEVSSNPIQYTNRNVVADIQKALMVDRSRGEYAQNTRIFSLGNHNYYQEGIIDILPVCTWVLVIVQRLIDADNPYQLA